MELGRILVIEDNLCLQTPMTRLIRRMHPDVSVEWATTADEVIQKMQADQTSISQYALVIADIVLPGTLSGLDFWQICKKVDPSLPFIFMSGMGVQEFLNLVQSKAPTPPFLPKPFRLQECQNAISRLI